MGRQEQNQKASRSECFPTRLSDFLLRILCSLTMVVGTLFIDEFVCLIPLQRQGHILLTIQKYIPST